MQGTILWNEGQNAGYIEEMLQLYRIDPGLVGPEWSRYFAGLADQSVTVLPPVTSAPRVNEQRNGAASSAAAAPSVASSESLELYGKMLRLVQSFRARGHLGARINPLTRGVKLLAGAADLALEHFGVQSHELDTELDIPDFGRISPRHLLTELQSRYCGSIGFEFEHMRSFEEREWWRSRIEAKRSGRSADAKQRALQKLIYAETLENELHRKFVGLKRFSVEGGETLVPMVDRIIERGAELGVASLVVGMAHRGRLNVLCNNLGKSLASICAEFEDHSEASVIGVGDVKYHLGHRGSVQAANGAEVEVELLPNPSHLEFVNPVVAGVVRARQDRRFAAQRQAVLPLVIHGDAAVAGQGVVFETINFAGTKAYSTRGTVHIVINNQVGFTTNPDDTRSTEYCTDMARGVGIPVMHVNAEDVEAALWAAETAIEYRQRFGKDVFIDLYCYRKYGHNEGDDPTFTQPIMYGELKGKDSIPEMYAAALVAEGVVGNDTYARTLEEYQKLFAVAQEEERQRRPGPASPVHGRLVAGLEPSGVPAGVLQEIAESSIAIPEGVSILPKLQKILEKRVDAVRKGEGIDWGFAEVLAFGSLLREGISVRLSGQDCGRGTFSQRHVNLSLNERLEYVTPIRRCGEESGASFEVYNSTLSEAAVVGFEFGYAAENDSSLTLWEAQFGDFVNGAQVMLDQFLASSEAKWCQRSGVTLLLPHGFEGQGPEHSSARIERFLQLCADNNMSVCVPSNAKQHFHLLRLQARAAVKRPLVVITPKSLLRLPDAAARIEELSDGEFEPVIVEDFGREEDPQCALMLCGKIYYDVVAALEKVKDHRAVRVIRVEQLYPFPEAQVAAALSGVSVSSVAWVQEEPRNMGAWNYMDAALRESISVSATYVGRVASPVTATGSHHRHAEEQAQVVRAALQVAGVTPIQGEEAHAH